MTDFGFLSILPPLFAIVLAIRTKQVLISLLLGLALGYIIIAGGNVFQGLLNTVDALIDVFASPGNTRTILFTLLIGALIQLIKYSGGINGFVKTIQTSILRSKQPKSKLQVAASLTGFLIFIESNISILTVGTVFQSLFDRFGISRQKLAYLADSSSAPSCILFPINAWGAYIIGLLAVYEGVAPFQTLLYSIGYNFYPILTLILVFTLAVTGKNFGPMKRFEAQTSAPVKSISNPALEDDGKARNMLIPLAVMIISMPLFLVYTGWNPQEDQTLGANLWASIADASGSAAVLYAVTLAVMFAGAYYAFQKKINLTAFIEESMAGMKDMLSMATLMMMAFAIGNLCKALGTGVYVAGVTESWLSPSLAPAVIFVTSCFIAFSTGTSWGTFAIMISIVVPLAQAVDLHLPLAVAAVLGGGVFGDHCSPISDTTLIASMASGSDHIDHVRTQLPYALATGGLAILLYLVIGFAI
ncbi:Na+/H+ antiporter NhaC family protein [Marinoscillum furvescens]|uniref:Transporter (NhaC family) n=1 Tax=Marinoscillum furvescens DSM 4134 TaxID=1122208 RepID=A0A3D9L055_MARFU|nr:Na+/H+ antiporter NhaC family protein [Marinoscillum furvescens]RED94357.1 transporter (NhaC family) [Marinoscillum furvescens DSM 4134]